MHNSIVLFGVVHCCLGCKLYIMLQLYISSSLDRKSVV